MFRKFLALAALLLASCASEIEIPNCSPDVVIDCECAPGVEGTQVCVDGMKYEACVCGPGGDTGATDGASNPDTNEGDSSVTDTRTEDTFARDARPTDTFVQDTFVFDTLVADTFVADTFVPDTFVPDTFVADTFTPDTRDAGGDAFDASKRDTTSGTQDTGNDIPDFGVQDSAREDSTGGTPCTSDVDCPALDGCCTTSLVCGTKLFGLICF